MSVKKQMSALEGMEVDHAKEKRKIEETHSYACKVGGRCESSPSTPSKTPAPKKTKNVDPAAASEPSLMEVQNNIIQILSEKINNRADHLEIMIKNNSKEIESICESLNSIHSDVMGLKNENESLKKENMEMKKKAAQLEQRMNDQERYSRRWCLRLHGVAENSSEKVKERVKEICRAVVPEEQRNEVTAAVDIVHRLGRLRAAEDQRGNPRPIIIRFISRTARDLIWKHARQSPFLQTRGLHFKEDLTAADKEARSRLWPAVDQARKEGKAAYFSGARAFIDGREIRPT